MKKVAIYLLSFYQKYLSLDSGRIPHALGFASPTCIYHPTCSEYMKQAMIRFGLIRGFGMGTKRLWRCTPSHTPGVDLVPEK